MKKVLISMLLVLLTLCLFVSCWDEPTPTPIVNEVKYISTDNSITVVLNRENNEKNKVVEFNTELPTLFSFEDTLKVSYNFGVWYSITFYKDINCQTPINSFDELVDLDTIYGKLYDVKTYNKVTE